MNSVQTENKELDEKERSLSCFQICEGDRAAFLPIDAGTFAALDISRAGKIEANENHDVTNKISSYWKLSSLQSHANLFLNTETLPESVKTLLDSHEMVTLVGEVLQINEARQATIRVENVL